MKKIQCGGMFYNVYLAYNIVFETIKHLNIYKVYQRRTYGVRVLRAPTHTYTSADIPFKPHSHPHPILYKCTTKGLIEEGC